MLKNIYLLIQFLITHGPKHVLRYKYVVITFVSKNMIASLCRDNMRS